MCGLEVSGVCLSVWRCDVLKMILAALGVLLVALGTLLAALWSPLGEVLAAFGALLSLLGRSWPVLGSSWPLLRRSCSHWGRSWLLLTCPGAFLDRLETVQEEHRPYPYP